MLRDYAITATTDSDGLPWRQHAATLTEKTTRRENVKVATLMSTTEQRELLETKKRKEKKCDEKNQ